MSVNLTNKQLRYLKRQRILHPVRSYRFKQGRKRSDLFSEEFQSDLFNALTDAKVAKGIQQALVGWLQNGYSNEKSVDDEYIKRLLQMVAIAVQRESNS